MTLELADRSITEPIGIAEDVFINVGKFQFPADFVVVDFEPDPRVPLILGRCFLKTSHALIDVYEGEITLRVGKEAITFNLDQTSKYTADYNHMTVNKIDVIDMACDEYSQEVLGFSNVIASGNPTPYFEPIVSTASPTLTPFGDSDFLLFEEADSFLALEDDPTSSEVDPTYQDPEGDILILEAILNSEPPPPLPNHEQYMPEVRKELKLCEAKTVEPSVNEPPEVELKELPPHLEYAFLEGDNKLPVIIAKDLKDEEKAALLKEVELRTICTKSEKGKPKIHVLSKRRWKKHIDAGLIYPISDSPWGARLLSDPLTEKIKKRQHSHAHKEHLPMLHCLLGYAMIPGTFQVTGTGLLILMCDASDILRNWTTGKILLAVVYAFEKFVHYLYVLKSIVSISDILPDQVSLCMKVIRRCVFWARALDLSKLVTVGLLGDTMVPITHPEKSVDPGFYWPTSTRMPMTLSPVVNLLSTSWGKITQSDEMPQNSIQVCEIFGHLGH
ncbi:reverse transcriptase domain-containing protein [Tanacetum coccineum]